MDSGLAFQQALIGVAVLCAFFAPFLAVGWWVGTMIGKDIVRHREIDDQRRKLEQSEQFRILCELKLARAQGRL